jgi:glycosyltransferase involved in cell wall biosynthesis
VHLSSVIEPEIPVRLFWPREASANGLSVAVTLYDLIPDVFPDWYLQDPGLRRRWRCCREVVRSADAVMTPSEATKQDAIRILGIPERRVRVIGSGTSTAFRPAESREKALRVAQGGVKGLEAGFIVYNGAFDPRKNVDLLVEAYASLPPGLVEGHQLVIVCEARPLTRNHYLVIAENLGIEGRLLIPGFVPEDVLIGLLQSAELTVFPSLYEGYGLPVVESMACGTPTIAGDNSSLREFLPRDARFDASDKEAIAAAIYRALTDEAFRSRLAQLAGRKPPQWGSVADRAAAVFEDLLQRSRTSRPGWRRRPHLALVGAPVELVTSFEPVASYDVLTSSDALSPGTPTLQLDALRGGFDAVVAWVPGLDAPAGQAMGQLAASWPGRAIAVLQGPLGADDATLSSSALRVITAGPTWPETAQRVAHAAGQPSSQ